MGIENQNNYVEKPKETKKINSISESVNILGVEKVKKFMDYYGIKPGYDIVFRYKVLEIQEKNGLKEDGILGNETYSYFLKGLNLNEKTNFSSNNEKTEKKEKTDLPSNNEKIFNFDSINKSKNFVGVADINFFINFFNIKSNSEFTDKVLEIQEDNGLKKDGIIGPATLEVIYEKYYKNLDNLPLNIANRKYLNKVIESYRSRKNIVGAGKNFNIAYSKNYFYGPGNSENNKNTSINIELSQKKEIPKRSDLNGGYSIQLRQLSNGKYYLALYLGGDLKVLSYASPGTKENRTPKYPNGIRVGTLTERYVSNSYPKRENGENGGAIMPLAYHLNGGIFGHVGLVTGSGASKGCVRVPGFYQVSIYETLKANPGKFKFYN